MSAASQRMPDIGERVEVVFEWDRDLGYSGTVEQTAPIVVHVPGQPDDDMSRLHLTDGRGFSLAR